MLSTFLNDIENKNVGTGHCLWQEVGGERKGEKFFWMNNGSSKNSELSVTSWIFQDMHVNFLS
jgi:hypothetical protein